MSFAVEVFPRGEFASRAAAAIAAELPSSGTVVVTGGGTARDVYRSLAGSGADWSGLDVVFSDERCVPPEGDASNYGMARASLFGAIHPRAVHRIRGEEDPDAAARAYAAEIEPLVGRGLDLTILGMGGDCHVCALFPGSHVLEKEISLCAVVDRPDGMKGITLTPPALEKSRKVLLVVTGPSKAEGVRRAIEGAESPRDCPVKLLEPLDATFLLDEDAAALLARDD